MNNVKRFNISNIFSFGLGCVLTNYVKSSNNKYERKKLTDQIEQINKEKKDIIKNELNPLEKENNILLDYIFEKKRLLEYLEFKKEKYPYKKNLESEPKSESNH